MDAADILPKGFACPHCGKSAGFTKEEDTLDGWFDSGSTHFAAMKKDQGFWPATMYLEGLDQYRGWFQSSLLTAVGAFGEGAPFKECVTHGWTVDGEAARCTRASATASIPPTFSTKRCGHSASVGGERRLSRGCALLQGHLPAAQPELSQVPQHLQVHAR